MGKPHTEDRSTLLIECVAAELRRMSQWLRAEAELVHLAPDTAYTLELCANEAVANILMHARPVDNRISLEFRADESDYSLRIEDHGPPFDPIAAEIPALPSNLDAAKPGGLGLVLIQQLLPMSHYTRDSDNNVLILRGSRIQPSKISVQAGSGP